MTAFQQCFFFLRAHDGGVEDLARMKAAGFGGVFCNIGDASPPDTWSTVRQRARDQGMFCGPWLRTQGADRGFDQKRLQLLIDTADAWESPLVCNSEKELDHSGDDLTSYIAKMLGSREAAISMEPWPFASVDWTPIANYPVLPQIFPYEAAVAERPQACRQQWYASGVRCVYFTFGSYGDQWPNDFNLQAPYSIYTADDCGYDYAAWSPTSTGYEGCQDIPWDGDDDMQMIGSQHGIEATYNRFKALDPGGCNPAFDPKKPAALPIEQLKAYDKWCRAMLILVQDHDAQVR